MSAGLSAAVGFVVGAVATLLVTPIALVIAHRTDFYDRPREYRQHGEPTPFLGGAAVLFGVLVAAVLIALLAHVSHQVLVALLCASGLWLLGTVDDWIAVLPRYRVLAEAGAACAIFAVGLRWRTTAGAGLDLPLTVVWVVGVVNAFNLMDNLDGACGTVGCVAAAGIGVLATLRHDAGMAGAAFALSGACFAFLRSNLAAPAAKIFLGDGGSMPVGFLTAALAMGAAQKIGARDADVLGGALLVGLPILDTALVSLSRTRRGVTLVTGGRDHLTHRLLLALGSPRAVAAALAAAQALLCTLAIVGAGVGTLGLTVLAIVAAAIGALVIAVLDTARWRPPGIAVAAHSQPAATQPPAAQHRPAGAQHLPQPAQVDTH